jgi:hypothetical protein
MPWLSIAARISSPIGPSRVVCMCSSDLKMNGSAGTIVSGTMLLSGATLIRIMSSPPILSCSTVSRSCPRAAFGNTFTPIFPPERSLRSLPMYSTAFVVG